MKRFVFLIISILVFLFNFQLTLLAFEVTTLSNSEKKKYDHISYIELANVNSHLPSAGRRGGCTCYSREHSARVPSEIRLFLYRGQTSRELYDGEVRENSLPHVQRLQQSRIQ